MKQVSEKKWQGAEHAFALSSPAVFRNVVTDIALEPFGVNALKSALRDRSVQVASTDNGIFRVDQERGHYYPEQMTSMHFTSALDAILSEKVASTYIPRLDISQDDRLLSIVPTTSSRKEQLLLPALWIGPSGNRMPLHHDFADNIFVQAVGKKRFVVLSPEYELSRYRLPVKMFGERASWHGTNISRTEDHVCDPDFPYNELQEAILGPGDVLWLPNLWWHEVLSLSTPTISVSSWWSKYALKHIQTAIREITIEGSLSHQLPSDWKARVLHPTG